MLHTCLLGILFLLGQHGVRAEGCATINFEDLQVEHGIAPVCFNGTMSGENTTSTVCVEWIPSYLNPHIVDLSLEPWDDTLGGHALQGPASRDEDLCNVTLLFEEAAFKFEANVFVLDAPTPFVAHALQLDIFDIAGELVNSSQPLDFVDLLENSTISGHTIRVEEENSVIKRVELRLLNDTLVGLNLTLDALHWCISSPTPSPSATHSITATVSASISASATGTPSHSTSPSPSATHSITATATPSPSASSSHTASSSTSPSPSATHSITATVSASISASATGTPSHSTSPSPSATHSITATVSASISASATGTPSHSTSPSPSATHSITATVSASISASATGTPSHSTSPSPSATHSITATATPSPSASSSHTASSSTSPSPSATHSITATVSASISFSATASYSSSSTASSSAAPSTSPTHSVTPSTSPTPSPVYAPPTTGRITSIIYDQVENTVTIAWEGFRKSSPLDPIQRFEMAIGLSSTQIDVLNYIETSANNQLQLYFKPQAGRLYYFFIRAVAHGGRATATKSKVLVHHTRETLNGHAQTIGVANGAKTIDIEVPEGLEGSLEYKIDDTDLVTDPSQNPPSGGSFGEHSSHFILSITESRRRGAALSQPLRLHIDALSEMGQTVGLFRAVGTSWRNVSLDCTTPREVFLRGVLRIDVCHTSEFATFFFRDQPASSPSPVSSSTTSNGMNEWYWAFVACAATLIIAISVWQWRLWQLAHEPLELLD